MTNKRTAVALGLFDGVHLGHRAVIAAAEAQRENGLSAVVFTFEPECALRKTGGTSGYIYTRTEKEILLYEQIGVDDIVSPRFDSICGLSGEEFAEEILCKQLHAAHVCCGDDFKFGKNAACGAQELTCFGKRFGFEVEVVGAVEYGGSIVSSSRIRELLLSGDIAAANELLGSAYFISAKVTDGNHIGRTIDFPTINQDFAEGQLVPRYGVYSTFTNVGGRVLPSVTNVGVKPTIEGVRRPLAETHIIGYSGDLYGKNIDVSFNSFIRPEMKFGSLDELKAQINADIQTAVNIS
ncbi:MAG: bifunctional riboflavin kinase/FAD synthetase [Ruminococcus sp.]|uniref:bifunctional riboflavin kinase/FAD synthetase n=1 Tax=Ruminococcus sp. TaxID=41978 RepID=UPI0025FFE7F3|nr:bifunctional riboflavin kinase/FAD synthetase [Ruminococcus sp.]MCR4796720.1 bifunctional riboflavin kinase/FAD synthetase [Ruminococcus sp.]